LSISNTARRRAVASGQRWQRPLLGPIGLVSLFSKKRKHYLTIGYTDADAKQQVAVIELGKDIVRSTLPIIETRSGKKIEYQDQEARKSGQ
jgi:hypothetical protein